MSNVVMSDGHGNVIRHTNPRRIGDSSSRGAGGVFGWTEDDSAPEAGLGAEFENALREVMEQANARTEAGSAAVGASAGVDASAGANTSPTSAGAADADEADASSTAARSGGANSE